METKRNRHSANSENALSRSVGSEKQQNERKEMENQMKTHRDNGQALRAGNLTGMDPQSTQEKLASLRATHTARVLGINRELPALELKIESKVTENGQQDFAVSTGRDGEEKVGRALFVMTWNEFVPRKDGSIQASRSRHVGTSSELMTMTNVWLSTDAVRDSVKVALREVKADQLSALRKRLAKMEAEMGL